MSVEKSMNLRLLKLKISVLERLQELASAQKITKRCNCCFAGPTTYHTFADLESILKIRCLVHGIRFHDCIVWVPLDVPLALSDQHCCSCLSDIWRNYRLGKREYPTAEEQAKYHKDWWKELTVALTPEGERAVLHEIAGADQLIKGYEKARGEAHGHNV